MKTRAGKISSTAAGTPCRSKVNGNEFKIPLWKKSEMKDTIDPNAFKFEVDRQGQYGVPILCSSVNFKNMETKLNAWTADTVYDPMTGGEIATYEPKSLMQKSAHIRSMKVLPSTINHSKETFNIVSGH